MKKKYIAYGLILIELIVQIIGFIDYNGAPAFLWTLADAIVFLVPLLFGTRLGLICLLPVAASEIVWFLSFHSVGALLHLLSFTLAVIILGTVNKKLNQTAGFPRVIFSIILFIAVWVGEEVLYRALVALFLQIPFAWEDVFKSILSPVTIVLVMVLAGFVKIDKSRASA